MQFKLEENDDCWANDRAKIARIYIPVGTVVEVAWTPRKGALAEDTANRGVERFVGTVRENHTHYINVWVDCPNGAGYMRSVNKVEIFTGETVITNYMTGKVIELSEVMR